MTSNYPNSERIPQGEASSFGTSKQDHQNGGTGRNRQYRQPDENTAHSTQAQSNQSGDSSKYERTQKMQGNSNFSNSGNPKSGGNNNGNNTTQWQQGQSNNRLNYQGGGHKDQYQQPNSSNTNNNRSVNNQDQFNRDINKGERANAQYAQSSYQQQQPDQLQMKGNQPNGNNPKTYGYQKKQPDQESSGNSYNPYNNGQNRPAKESYNSYNSNNNYNSNSTNYNNRQEGYNNNNNNGRYENNNNGYSGQGQNYKNQRNNNNNSNYTNNKQYQQQDRQSSRQYGGGQKIFTEKPAEVSQQQQQEQYVPVSNVMQNEKSEVVNDGFEAKENLNPPSKEIIQQESLTSEPAIISVEETPQHESENNVQNSVSNKGGVLEEKTETSTSEKANELNPPDTQSDINQKGHAKQEMIKDVTNVQESLQIAPQNTKVNEKSEIKSEIQEIQQQVQVEEQQVQQESTKQENNQNEQMLSEKEEEENKQEVSHDEDAEIRKKQKELETALEDLEYVQFESEWIVWMCFSPEQQSQSLQDEHTFLLNNQPVINFDNLKKLCLLLQNSRFSHVSQFFIFKYLKKLQFDSKYPSMRNVEAISFFKKGIKPIWEDEKNIDGQDLQTKFSGASPHELDQIYHYLLVKVFCEEFPFKSQLNGFRFADKGNSKKSGVRLELWFDKLSDSELISIKEYFTEMIHVKWNNPMLQWKTHK